MRGKIGGRTLIPNFARGLSNSTQMERQVTSISLPGSHTAIECPVVTALEQAQAERIESFYEDECVFEIRPNRFKQFRLTLLLKGERIVVGEEFPSIPAVFTRVAFCKRLGIHGGTCFNKEPYD